jgi:creatinine amidohydrolase/Fe(II)-dependent formamide hydrolase-like protein
VDFVVEREDFHAGGVETALVQHINPELVDTRWWPGRLDDLAAGQLPMTTAVELSSVLPKFIQHVESHPLNGIVGNIRNFFDVDAPLMMERMLRVAREDVRRLIAK